MCVLGYRELSFTVVLKLNRGWNAGLQMFLLRLAQWLNALLDSRLWHTVQSRLPWCRRAIVAYLNSCELLSLIMHTEKNPEVKFRATFTFSRELYHAWALSGISISVNAVLQGSTKEMHYLVNNNRHHCCYQSAVVFFVYSLLPQYQFSHW